MAEEQSNPQSGGARVRVFIEDHTGNKTREARLTAHTEISQLVPALVTALNLPVTDPSGRAITYHLAFDSRQLQRDETLASARVEEGAALSLVPELTAGQGEVQ